MRSFFGIICFMVYAASACAEVTFAGYMIAPGRQMFVLKHDTQGSSGWLTIGQSFDGFALVAFDSTAEILTIEKEGKRDSLHLAEGRVQAEAIPTTTTKPIVILIGTQESLFLADDAAMLEALKMKLTHVAATEPQPAISIRVSQFIKMDRVHAILNLCKALGIQRYSFSARD